MKITVLKKKVIFFKGCQRKAAGALNVMKCDARHTDRYCTWGLKVGGNLKSGAPSQTSSHLTFKQEYYNGE